VSNYDQAGRTYSRTRRTDPRIAAQIERALGGCTSVANIGAGTGSYEPSQTVVAVEPSRVMIAQRSPNTAPAVQGTAEQLPIRTDAVDAALAVLTVHHWTDLERGVAEMVRIARRRVVILTWDHSVFKQFWLIRDYLPAAAEADARLAVSLRRLSDLLGAVSVQLVPVPHDCLDGFAAAFWRRPSAYLDDTVQAGISALAHTPPRLRREGLARLRADIDNGSWAARYADLLQEPTFDAGYRLVVADLH
jgi:SAM-dependent methyltransferase